jgi:hypothetical protein
MTATPTPTPELDPTPTPTQAPDVEAADLAAQEEMDRILTATLSQQMVMGTTTHELVFESIYAYVTRAGRDLLDTQEFPQVKAAE